MGFWGLSSGDGQEGVGEPASLPSRDTGRRPTASRTSCAVRDSVCRSTPRRWRAAGTRTAMRSSAPSMSRSAHRDAGQPVISVDTQKQELLGPFKNAGREWRPAGEPVPVNVYDFAEPATGKVVPYGIDDIAASTDWVNATCRRAPRNGTRWSTGCSPHHDELAQQAADQPRSRDQQHRRHHHDHRTTVQPELDTGTYPLGARTSNADLAAPPLTRHPCHGDRNYALHPTWTPTPTPPATTNRPIGRTHESYPTWPRWRSSR
ncbi:DDE family transposase [Nonomuraea fuscirosea]|uniref:DDE family transposase n=1 Tax=Nonomuraea fuscirosea TaxID=1291556 RepID=A0A2T0LJU6_9ACTN|nr:DDE family transposase [Nonomuraea fuscirosea]